MPLLAYIFLSFDSHVTVMSYYLFCFLCECLFIFCVHQPRTYQGHAVLIYLLVNLLHCKIYKHINTQIYHVILYLMFICSNISFILYYFIHRSYPSLYHFLFFSFCHTLSVSLFVFF